MEVADVGGTSRYTYSTTKLYDAVKNIDGLVIPISGRFENHYVTVIMDRNDVVHLIMRDVDLSVKATDNNEAEYRKKLLEESPLHIANPEVFDWYCDRALDALSKIGDEPRSPFLIDFKAYETVGACFGHTAGLARVDF